MSLREVSGESSFLGFPKEKKCENRLVCITLSLALAAIAAVASYYCLVNGLSMLDNAYTSLSEFTSGFLIYSGVIFSVVAAGNLCYVGVKNLFHNEEKPFEYTPNAAKIQVGVSILAPVALVPCVIVLALYGIFSNRN